MRKITKKNKFIAAVSMLLMTTIAAVVVSTIAWYSDIKAFTPYDVTSSVITSYFDSGSGTQADPFVITRPIHYYNLIYLHENNELEINGTPFADAELYFQFGKKNCDGYTGTADDNVYLFYKYNNAGVLQYIDEEEDLQDTSTSLNMNYYQGDKALMPIGTSAHPFIGHITGNNLTVSNLHINGYGLCDVGVFGYVGEGATISNLYFESPNIDVNTTNPTATSGTGHTSHDTHSYIGYIAGHVYNASTSFTDVYVNHCVLRNSTGNTNEQINTTGYFGHVDFPSTITADSASYATEMSAPSAYAAINDSYAAGSAANVTTRNTGYTASGSYGTAMSTSNNTYTSNSYSNSSNPYSLSTIGYENGDTVTEHIRYYDSNDNNELKRISTGTVELDSKPSSWTTYNDGYYLYYDTTESKWQYVSVYSPENPEPTSVDYNCITISYTYNDTVYYCIYTSGTLGVTTTAPGDASAADLNNYYFVLKASAGSTGVASLTQGDDPADYYIYSPQNQSYLYSVATSSVSHSTCTFVSSIGDATLYTVEGPRSSITFTNTNPGCLDGTTSVGSLKTVGTVTATTFDLGFVQSRYTDDGSVYDQVTLLTDISDGDTLAIGAVNNYNGTVYTEAMSTTQNANNRGTVSTTIDSDNRLTYASGMAKLTVNIDGSGYYTFYDPANSGYLYSAGTADTGKNFLRTSTTPDSGGANWGRWRISLDTAANEYIAHITSVGNTHTPYLRFNILPNQYNIFACYNSEASTVTYATPRLFKKNATSGTTEIFSNAVVLTFTSQVVDEQVITYFDLHTASNSCADPNNAAYYSATAFAVQRTASVSVVFNKSTSKVTYTSTAINRWQKVTATSELTAGDSVLLVHEYSDASPATFTAMSTTQNSNNRGIVSGIEYVAGSPNYIEDSVLTGLQNYSSIQQVTLEAGFSSSSYFSLSVGTNSYLYAASSSSNYLRTATEKSSNTDATITISSGDATITYQGSYSHNLLQYNASSSIFSCYTSAQKTVQIYKHIVSSTDTATYIGDLVGDRYDPDRIDVVGPATYTSTYVEISGSISSAPTLSAASIGSRFYTTSFAKNAITVLVDVTGSRDLGTLYYEYTASSSSVPAFATGDASNPVNLSSAGARDVDTNAEDSVHAYLMNFTTNNIKSLSLCAIDSSGNICAVYSSTGTLLYGSADNISKYVVEIGNTTGTIRVTDVQYTFTSAEGNVGNFGSVDYRTATYGTDNVFNGSAGQVTTSFISIYYDVATIGQTFSITVDFDSTTNTYAVTVVTSVNITLNVFNYDANTYSLTVNGTSYYLGTNIIAIVANNA